MSNFSDFFNWFIQNKSIIITTGAIVLLVIVVASCFSKWNEIWYEFGKNIYYLINGK